MCTGRFGEESPGSRARGFLGRGHLLGQRRGAADQATVIIPSAHLSVHLHHMPADTSIREFLPADCIRSTTQTQNPVTHTLNIAVAGLLSGCPNRATSHGGDLRGDQGCLRSPNQMHFGLSVASPRLLLTTKLPWRCPHQWECRGRKH